MSGVDCPVNPYATNVVVPTLPPPRSGAPDCCTPGATAKTDCITLVTGSLSARTSAGTLTDGVADVTSTTGLTPETVTDSSTAPTLSCMLTVALNPAGTCTPSRMSVWNPASSYVIL